MPLNLSGSNGVSGVDGSASTPALQGSDSNTGIHFPAADTVAIDTGGSERLRVDSSGRCGIGTASPQKRFVTSNGGAEGVEISPGDSSNKNVFLNYNRSSGAYITATHLADIHTWGGYGGTGSSEAMRIDASGRLLVNTSSISSGNGTLYVQEDANSVRNCVAVNNTASGTSSVGFVAFYRSGTFTGGISNTGSATAYNTSSDYRLKENIVPLTGAADRLNQLQVCRFNFIADPDHTVDGFIAHEAQAVVPECVTGTKDEVDDDGNPIYQGIDQSKLVPLLTAALQEAMERIETLETRLNALEVQP